MCSKLVEGLSWDNPIEMQKQSVQMILNCGDFPIEKLSFVNCSKPCWENCAAVLSELGFLKVKSITKDLLAWLQDMNWPGAQKVLKLLVTFPSDFLLSYYEDAILNAVKDKDECWLWWLSYFVYSGKYKMNDFSDPIYYYLMLHNIQQWEI